MRHWIKYAAVPRAQRPIGAIARSAEDYFVQMGGYFVDESYRSKSKFFAKHLHSNPRLVAYDRYLQRRITSGERILSVASGRCANELQLMESIGADVLCSDLREPPCLDATKAIFPNLKFTELDVLKDEPPEVFDTVLSLSLIYAMDDTQLFEFFVFARRALKPNGRLLLDLAGSPDNVFAWLLHDVFLPAEAGLFACYMTLRRRLLYRVQAVHHGYRRSLADLSRVAQHAGFMLVDIENDGFDLDLRRGVLLSRFADTDLGSRSLSWVGRYMPYIRMAQLVPTSGAPVVPGRPRGG
jgi:cyclopropane fatty-acyl-phospholipid synthase-like methyltransferase